MGFGQAAMVHANTDLEPEFDMEPTNRDRSTTGRATKTPRKHSGLMDINAGSRVVCHL